MFTLSDAQLLNIRVYLKAGFALQSILRDTRFARSSG